MHWKAKEADEKLIHLRSAGFGASKVPAEMPVAFKQLRENPPDAVVVDLSRLPSAGRDVALSLRSYKSTRHVPIVFVGGEPGKVALIRKFLPDVTYTTWDDIRSSLEYAMVNPPTNPIVPKSRLAGYAGVPLPKKLGIKKALSSRSSPLPRGSRGPSASYLKERAPTTRFRVGPMSRSGSCVPVWSWKTIFDG